MKTIIILASLLMAACSSQSKKMERVVLSTNAPVYENEKAKSIYDRIAPKAGAQDIVFEIPQEEWPDVFSTLEALVDERRRVLQAKIQLISIKRRSNKEYQCEEQRFLVVTENQTGKNFLYGGKKSSKDPIYSYKCISL